MTVPKLNYLVSDPDRHGNPRCYVRVAGKPKVRIHPRPGTAAFTAAYNAALTKLGVRPALAHSRCFVYVATGPAETPVKIGISREPQKRLPGLQTGSPVAVTMPFLFETTLAKARALEAHLHTRLAAWRSHGEWFDLPLAEAKKAIKNAAAGRPIRISF